MKNLIITIFFITGLVLTGCNHDDEPVVDYYVRYTAIAKPNAKVRMYFRNETSENSHVDASMPDGKFQYCVGPVKRGFEAVLGASYYDAGGYADYLSIEVAIGSAPFVLKKNGTNTSGLLYVLE
ncbi:MAG: hypothetical protein K2N48_05350 [Muribaculaceae bacterium]|nr:hypothetical protein [Muribaculaceae bacterium]